MDTKICNKCKEEKSLEEFYYRDKHKNLHTQCKKCLLKKTSSNKKSRQEEFKKLKKTNPENEFTCNKCNEQKLIYLMRSKKECYVCYNAYMKNRHDKIKYKMYDYLSCHPCIDCEEKNILFLDFDHLRDKSFNIGKCAGKNANWERVQEEIKKCVVRCRNCHSIKTHQETNSIRWKYYSEFQKEENNVS